jgi:hypothetical protein
LSSMAPATAPVKTIGSKVRLSSKATRPAPIRNLLRATSSIK